MKNATKWTALLLSFANVSLSLLVLSLPVIFLVAFIISLIFKIHLNNFNTIISALMFVPALMVLLKFYSIMRQPSLSIATNELDCDGVIVDENIASNDATSERIRLAFIKARSRLSMGKEKITIIRSHQNEFNAAAISSFKDSVVVVYDGLTLNVDDEKLVAVIGHELGHIKNKDSLQKVFLFAIQYFVPFASILSNGIIVGIYNSLIKAKNTGINLVGVALYITFRVIFFSVSVSLWINKYINAFAFKQSEYIADQCGAVASSKQAMINLLEHISLNEGNQKSVSPLYLLLAEHPKTTKRIKFIKSI